VTSPGAATWIGATALAGLLLLSASPARAASPKSPPPGPYPPVAGRPRVSSRFGWRVDPIDHVRRFHTGLDVVGAVGDGGVRARRRPGGGGGAGRRGRRAGRGERGDAGRAAGRRWSFAHLSTVLVRRGERVVRGQALGFSGSTGRATGPHLHVQVSDASGRLDPELLYPAGTFANPRRAA
jgi:murein DD-endopeptidase MepM/ murein hydrolase activator NlpD